MNNERFEQLKKDLAYAKMEEIIPSNKDYKLFRNSEEAIQAIRNNQIPGINWTEEHEQKYIDQLNKEARGAD